LTKPLARIGFCFAVLPQTPTDGLVDEEFCLPEVVDCDFFEQFRVRPVFVKQLMVNDGATRSNVFVNMK
jgi:hypothetical protein